MFMGVTHHAHSHTPAPIPFIHPPPPPPAPIHPTSPPPRLPALLYSHRVPLSLGTEQRCLSRSLSSPPAPSLSAASPPVRYLSADNHGNSSTVGTGHQLTKIDSRKMEGKNERKGSLHPRRPVCVCVCLRVCVCRRSMGSSKQTGTQAPRSPPASTGNKGGGRRVA